MADVVQADLRAARRLAKRSPTGLVVLVGGTARSPSLATIRLSVGDKRLARSVSRAVTRILRAAVAAPVPPFPIVRVPSRRAVERRAERLEGAVAIVPVTPRNLQRLAEIVTSVRGAGVLGVQLAWDGRDPSRDRAEAKLFAILEDARATPAGPPVVLARGEEPVEALRILIAHRR
jgi:hypothetical protein